MPSLWARPSDVSPFHSQQEPRPCNVTRPFTVWILPQAHLPLLSASLMCLLLHLKHCRHAPASRSLHCLFLLLECSSQPCSCLTPLLPLFFLECHLLKRPILISILSHYLNYNCPPSQYSLPCSLFSLFYNIYQF